MVGLVRLALVLSAVAGVCLAREEGTPVYTGVTSFPTEAFASMYYTPKHMEQEPRPMVTRVNGGTFPDSLNNPTTLPTAVPTDPVQMPPPLHGGEQVGKLIQDVWDVAGQLFRLDKSSSLTCNLCRTGLKTLQSITDVNPEILPGVMTAVCESFNLLGKIDVAQQCAKTFAKEVYGGPITEVMRYANFSGDAPDATQICAQIPRLHLCDWPSEKLSDSFLNDWFRGKHHAPKNITERWAAKQAHAAKWPRDDMLRVLHMSDLHIDGRYQVGSESACTFGTTKLCCQQDSTNNTMWSKQGYHGKLPKQNISQEANYWGSLTCDAPWSLIGNTMQAIQALGGKKGFDLALFTGDLGSHDDLYRYSREYVEWSEQAMYDIMKHFLGDTPLISTLGNHDMGPENIMTHRNLPGDLPHLYDWDLNYLADLWSAKDWINSTQQNQIRTHAGAYSISPRKGLRVISLDTQLWYFGNFYNYIHSSNVDPSGMLRFLTDELLAAEEAGERVWIMGHVLTGWNGSQALDKPANLFYQIVSRFAPHTIAHIFFGHTHEDQFQLFYRDTQGESATVNQDSSRAVAQAFIAPSVTTLTKVNPSVRVYSVDPLTFDVYDYDQYYTQAGDFQGLVDNKAKHGPIWRHLYSAREAFSDMHASVQRNKYKAGVTLNGTHWPAHAPLNGSFWAALTDEMEARPSLVKYFSELQGRLSPETATCDDHECQTANICYMRSGSPTLGRKCNPDYATVAR